MAKVKLKKSNPKKSPRNFRFITERFSKLKKNKLLFQKLKFQTSIFLYIATIAIILFLILDLFTNFQKQKKINFEKEKIQSEIKLWENIADKFKGYKDAYYHLAVLEFEIGNLDKAKFYISKSLYLDPNFEEGKELKKILDSY